MFKASVTAPDDQVQTALDAFRFTVDVLGLELEP